ncbi:MAG: hypothetical protein K0V04_26250 [Deltaproteobacteria bacterium]|nr:hypothetical protein [Deltaproteobacteria bacterium]
MSIEAQHAHATSQTVGTEGYFALARSRVSPAGSRAQLAPSRATVMDFQVPGAATRSVLSLESTAHLELLLDRLSGERRNVELRIGAAGSAAIYLSEGKIAWVRLDEHPENLGAVLRRELGLPMASVCEAIAHCRSTGQRFGAGLVELSMVTPDELRDCMLRHFADQLWELLDRDGPVVVEQLRASHRYDHDYTFTLSELLARPSMPSALEGQRLVALVERC